MTRTLRDQIAIIESEGLSVIEIIHKRHAKLVVAAPDGRTKTITVSVTPSHPNFVNRLRADARRFARQAS